MDLRISKKCSTLAANFKIMEKLMINIVDIDGNSTKLLTAEDMQNYIDELQSAASQEFQFFSGKTHVSKMYEFMNPEYRQIFSSKEKNVVHQMFSTSSQLFRSDYKIDNQEERNIWNNIVLSMPKSDRKIVYRYLHEYDRMDVHVGDILTIEHSLTTTIMGRKFTSSYNYVGKYIIRCKSQRQTKAHDVSMLWDSNYSILKGEKQINFEEGASFQIDKIKNVHGKPYIYMHEI